VRFSVGRMTAEEEIARVAGELIAAWERLAGK